MISDSNLQKLYDDFLKFADDMCSDYSPMEVAAVMMAQALTIYKSALSDDDYNKIVDSMSSSRDKVKTFSKPVIQ